MSALDVFSPRDARWFEGAFAGPTPAQELGWPAIARGGHTLIQAPTGSGKTLAAFLYGIDRLKGTPGEGIRLLYVSPLKALNYDVERNLRGPLAGLNSSLDVGVRTGDTPQKERAAMLRKPPDILITTPESLYLLLTSRARENLRGVETLILDEVHAVAGTKRGAHLALSRRAAGAPRREAAAADRPVRDPAPARGDRPLRGGAAARSSWWTPAARRSSTSRSSSRSTTCGSPAAAAASRNGRHGAHDADEGAVLDLAVHLSRAAPARARAPLDHRLRQQPPARRAARAPAERARRGGDRPRAPRLDRARAADGDRGAAQGGADPVPGRDVVARARDRHGRRRPRHPGRVAEVGRPRPAARRPRRATSSAPCRKGRFFPKFRADLLESRGGREADARGRDRGDVHPAQPTRRPRAADRRDLRRGGDHGGRAARAGARRIPVRGSLPRPARERPGHARRPLSVGRVRRAAPADRLGSHRRARPCARGRSAARGAERAARSPTAASSASTWWTGAAASASWTRRWSTRRVPGR